MKLEKQKNGGALLRADKGTSINPNGRPKGARNKTTVIKEVFEALDKKPPESIQELKAKFPKLSTIELMIAVQIEKAITKSDTQAFKVIIENAFPPHTQQIQIEYTEEELMEEIRHLHKMLDIDKKIR